MESNLLSVFLLILLAAADVGKAGVHRRKREIPPMTVPQLIRYWGYVCEEHFVETVDGFTLGLHRIPHARNESDPQSKSKTPILLGHGIISSSAVFSFGPPERSFAYILADAGFDVWMVNHRGNPYSRIHEAYRPCDEEKDTCANYWAFGLHEMALGDYTAAIDYILMTTNQTSLYFSGHSMAGSLYLILLAERPGYNEKIRAGFLLAPASFMTYAKNWSVKLSPFASQIEKVMNFFGRYEFQPQSKMISWMARQFCDLEKSTILADLCANVAFQIMGLHREQINMTMGPIYLDHFPAATSTRTFRHYAQLHMTNEQFIKYDFGDEFENFRRYGNVTPPAYNLTRVTAPTAIYIGVDDEMVTLRDAGLLNDQLPNVIHYEMVQSPGWAHIDFIIGIDARKYLYDPIIAQILKMEADRNKSPDPTRPETEQNGGGNPNP